MLCGLLPATSGTLRVAGWICAGAGIGPAADRLRRPEVFALRAAFVIENLEFFASAYGLQGAEAGAHRLGVQQFELMPLTDLPSGQLPGGYKQRLAMAAALLHEPETLFLDEPTSGADPLARREFWRRITALAEQGVTVIVTTHFMEEADTATGSSSWTRGAYWPRARPPMSAAAPIKTAEPGPRWKTRLSPSLRKRAERPTDRRTGRPREDRITVSAISVFRQTTCAYGLSCGRNPSDRARPSSIAIGIVLPLVLIFLFGYGLSLDVKHVPVAVVLEDPSPDATELAASFQLSPYFDAQLFTSMPRAQNSCWRERSTRLCVSVPTLPGN